MLEKYSDNFQNVFSIFLYILKFFEKYSEFILKLKIVFRIQYPVKVLSIFNYTD